MSLHIELEMLGLLLIGKSTVDPEVNPLLFNMMVQVGIPADVLQDTDRLRQRYISTIMAIEDDVAYYDAMELQTNESLDLYLKDLANSIAITQGERSRQVAINISCLGNKGGEFGHTDGVDRLREVAQEQITKLYGLHDHPNDDPMEAMTFQMVVHNLHQALKALELVDVFVMSRLGAVSGVPEFPDAALTDIDEIPEPDFELRKDGCAGDEQCACGCQLAHPILIVEGLEDFLLDRETPARAYVEGVARANSIRLDRVAGQEGAVFDAIKEVGRKAWEAAVESLKAVKTMFEEGDSEEQLSNAEDTATNNKKALQGMKDGVPARINDSARKGISDLAEQIDPSGKLKNVVASLNTPTDGARVLDALLGFMRKGAIEGAGVEGKVKDAQAAIDELKKASDSAGQGDEENKDVVAANKAKVQEKVAEAKEAMKKLKEELKQHNKWMSGLKKAIAGISPKIFIEDTSKSD